MIQKMYKRIEEIIKISGSRNTFLIMLFCAVVGGITGPAIFSFLEDSAIKIILSLSVSVFMFHILFYKYTYQLVKKYGTRRTRNRRIE